ncbi:hypothetical protein D3C78_1871250 [compost metagenome]
MEIRQTIDGQLIEKNVCIYGGIRDVSHELPQNPVLLGIPLIIQLEHISGMQSLMDLVGNLLSSMTAQK